MQTEDATAILGDILSVGPDNCSSIYPGRRYRFAKTALKAADNAGRKSSPLLAGEALLEAYAALKAKPPLDGSAYTNGWTWYHGNHPIQVVAAASVAEDEDE